MSLHLTHQSFLLLKRKSNYHRINDGEARELSISVNLNCFTSVSIQCPQNRHTDSSLALLCAIHSNVHFTKVQKFLTVCYTFRALVTAFGLSVTHSDLVLIRRYFIYILHLALMNKCD